LNSPQFECEPLGQELGVNLVLKLETLNPLRCFKGRGADWLVSQVTPGTHLFTASAGNLRQAMAFACRARGASVTVYASRNANPFKLKRMRALGADVVLKGQDFDAAKQAGKQAALEAGARFVEDSLDIETLEGAGTIGLELATHAEPLDTVLVALGNGAMLVGVVRAIKATSPRTRVVAVQGF
jgi:threonine dehydratase